MKIFVAIPVNDGKLQHQTVECLMLEQSIANKLGDEIFPCFVPNCSHLPDARNTLVKAFLKSECDRLVFLDSDITFEAGALIKIARQKFDFVAGCTRRKTAEEYYPMLFTDSDEPLQTNEYGLFEIGMIGTAFLSLSRDVFKILDGAYSNRNYESHGDKKVCYFEMPFVAGEQEQIGSLYGEDAYFCKLWREAGGKIWLYPELEITHWDFNKPYVGHIGKWLKSKIEQTPTKDC